MQISERIWMVGSGKHGSEISHRMDCNLFLLRGGDEYALIDAGSGLEPERIVANIERIGVSMSQVKQLLITHIHGDHAAGASYFYQQYGMQTIVAEEAAPWLEAGDMEKSSLTAAIQAGIYPKDFLFPACPVTRRVAEGDEVQVGDLRLQVIETPGHSRGHVSYLVNLDEQLTLFAGDSVFAGGKVVIQNIWDCSIQEYAETLARLHKLHIDCLFPGHGALLLSEAWRHIELAHERFEKLDIPPNL